MQSKKVLAASGANHVARLCKPASRSAVVTGFIWAIPASTAAYLAVHTLALVLLYPG